jgi:hypothetical protein
VWRVPGALKITASENDGGDPNSKKSQAKTRAEDIAQDFLFAGGRLHFYGTEKYMPI